MEEPESLPINNGRGVSLYLSLAVLLAAVILVISRRPDSVFNPQFWAEDGIWYSQAYHLGLKAIFLPHKGYLQTISRVTAALSLPLPLHLAPLFFNVVAIAVQVLPAVLIVTSRFAALVPSLPARLLLAFLYLALPGSAEIHGNITNAQWHLALVAFMVLVAAPGRHRLWDFFDAGIILLSGLSGPFCILLIPIAWFRWLKGRNRRLLSLSLLTTLCAVVQVGCLLLLGHDRAHTPLGIALLPFLKILGGQVFLVPLAGERGILLASNHGWYWILVGSAFAAGCAVIATALLKAPVELRLFVVFAGAVFLAALVSPPDDLNVTWWSALGVTGQGGRYWFMPNVAFTTVLVCLAGKASSLGTRAAAGAVAAVMALGIVLDWSHPPLPDFAFPQYARAFEQSPKATLVDIPINPPGWSFQLLKR